MPVNEDSAIDAHIYDSMPHTERAFIRPLGMLIAVLLAGAGCGTIRGVSALREVDFEPDRVTGVRLAGLALDHVGSAEDLDPAQVATVAAGALIGTVPLELDVVVRATNPASNPVAAKVLRMNWMLLLAGKDTVGGTVNRPYTIAPGQTVEVPVHVAVDLADVVGRHAGTLLRLGLALAGEGNSPVEVGLRLAPVIETPLGGMRVPAFTIPLESVGR